MTPAAVAAADGRRRCRVAHLPRVRGACYLCSAHSGDEKETVWTDFFVTAALKRKRGAVGMPFETGEVGNNERAEQELKEGRGFCRRMGNSFA